jgi:integrase
MAKLPPGVFKRERSSAYWISYTAPGGDRVRESSGKTTIRDAVAERESRMRPDAPPKPVKESTITFNDLAEEYVPWMLTRQKGAERTYKYTVRYFQEKFGRVPLASFNSRLLERWQTELMEDGLENSTINRKMTTLKSMFTKAKEWGMCSKDVLEKVRAVKALTDSGERLRYLSYDECRALLLACEGDVRNIVLTALTTGMRKTEIFKLEWKKNIDLKHKFILLRSGETKSGKMRQLPICSSLFNVMEEWLEQATTPYVFPNPRTGKPYYSIQKRWTAAVAKVEIEDFHFHDLRHTYASHMVMRGTPLATVSNLLGHANIKMTMRYSHLSPEHAYEAVEGLGVALAAPSPLQIV